MLPKQVLDDVADGANKLRIAGHERQSAAVAAAYSALAIRRRLADEEIISAALLCGIGAEANDPALVLLFARKILQQAGA